MVPKGLNWQNEIKESTWFPFILNAIGIKLLWLLQQVLASPAASSSLPAQCSNRSRGRDGLTQKRQSTQKPVISLCLFFSLTILFRGSFAWFSGGRQSYQTGIHHKSTPSPELVQLPAPQRHRQAGEESARHQVEQSRLAHLHHGQGHEGDEQADAVCCRERRRCDTVRSEHTHTHTLWVLLSREEKAWLVYSLLSSR